MAHALGLPIGEYLARTTHRQHLVWLAWLEMQWDRPDRTDHYLMQIAAEVLRPNTKDPNGVNANDFKLKFTDEPKPALQKLSVEDNKKRWMRFLGVSMDEERSEELPGVKAVKEMREKKRGSRNRT